MSDLRRSARAGRAARRLAVVLIVALAMCCAAAVTALARTHHRRGHIQTVRPTRGMTAHGQLLHVAHGQPLQLIANTNESSNWFSYNQGTLVSTTTIYSASGAVLGHVAGAVNAFSWDGSLAVVGSFNYGPLSIVRWRDGSVVWTGPTGGGYLGAMAEPGGQRIAVTVSDPQHPQAGGFYPGDVYVVGPDGHAVKLLAKVITAG